MSKLASFLHIKIKNYSVEAHFGVVPKPYLIYKFTTSVRLSDPSLFAW